jgi:hypothetical protein
MKPGVEFSGYSAVLAVHELVFLVVVAGAGGDLHALPRLLRPAGPTTARMVQMSPAFATYSVNWPPPMRLTSKDVSQLVTVVDDLARN